MKHILIVEDDQRLGSLLTDALRDAGYEAEYAPDLAEAEAIMARRAIDAAILDIRLGDSLSFQLARRLGERNIPYLFASSARRLDMPQELRWQPLIGKPYTAEQLITSLQALCGDIYRADRSNSGERRDDGQHPSI